jgi:uncharacterized protein (DUF305 family)
MKYILFLFGLHFFYQTGFAQEKPMGDMFSMSDENLSHRNIYLKMMDTMMIQMEGTSDSTSIESNFLLQMTPHHKAAVAMADYEIQFGSNFVTLQLAKSIRAEQENEIQLMQIWIKQSHDMNHLSILPEEYRISMTQSMNQMMINMPADGQLSSIDQAFLRVMMPHHQAAVDMARIIISYSADKEIALFAQHIISSQEVEIEQMMAAINFK